MSNPVDYRLDGELPTYVYYPDFRSTPKETAYVVYNTATSEKEFFSGSFLELMEAYPLAEKRTWDWTEAHKRNVRKHPDQRIGNPYLQYEGE